MRVLTELVKMVHGVGVQSDLGRFMEGEGMEVGDEDSYRISRGRVASELLVVVVMVQAINHLPLIILCKLQSPHDGASLIF